MSYLENIPQELIYIISSKTTYVDDLVRLIEGFEFLNKPKIWKRFFSYNVAFVLGVLNKRQNYDIISKMFKEWDNLNDLLVFEGVGGLFFEALYNEDTTFAGLIFNRFSKKFDLEPLVFEYLSEEDSPSEDVIRFLLTDTFKENKFKADVISATYRSESELKLIKEYSIRFNLEQMLKVFHKSYNRLELLSFLINEYHEEFINLGYAKSFIEFILKLVREEGLDVPEIFDLLKILYNLIK